MRILLVQTSFLGDTILSTPLIGAIARLHPECELWMMTTPLSSSLVKHDPLLKGVIVYDKRGLDRGLTGLWKMAGHLRNLQFDRVYSLHRSLRTSLLLYLSGIPERIGFAQAKGSFLYSRVVERRKDVHDVLRNLSLLAEDFKNLDELANLRLTPPPEEDLSAKVQELSSSLNRYYVLFPGSVWKTKQWHWKHYLSVAEHFLAEGTTVLLLGGPEDQEIASKIFEPLSERFDKLIWNLVGDTSIAETMFLVSRSSLIVCNDSMSLHLASAFKIPNVAVFCATSPEFGFGPWRNRAIVVEKEGLSCKPCRRHGSNSCPTGTESCMRDLPADRVITAAEKLMVHGENSDTSQMG